MKLSINCVIAYWCLIMENNFEGKLCDAVNHKEVIAAYLGDFDANS